MVYRGHEVPCLQCQPESYIRMVQHLIEKCLTFHMNREDCIKTLAKCASIDPQVTLTVWEELLKENRSFFEEYFHTISPGNCDSKMITEYEALNFRGKTRLEKKEQIKGETQ